MDWWAYGVTVTGFLVSTGTALWKARRDKVARQAQQRLVSQLQKLQGGKTVDRSGLLPTKTLVWGWTSGEVAIAAGSIVALFGLFVGLVSASN